MKNLNLEFVSGCYDENRNHILSGLDILGVYTCSVQIV